ncbi:tripartite tricarboxylate transporter substrate binding protein [Pigmentiphaga soli]|uniref:Tripartite tricarboxylate transporter substrate binding protein n=2 Tax=Pigmentiphaga soli TaxID=1007095 RepID=A0ABP8HRN9_9BURK
MANLLRPHRRTLRAAAILGAGLLATGAAHAAYPERAISMVVAYPPGGGVDTVARVLSVELSKLLKQSVVVENKPGAGATIGASYVKRATPDGYTLLLADPAFVINTGLMTNVGYDLKKDFTPVSTVTMSPIVLSVYPGLPVHSLAELLEAARRKPGGLSYSSAGIGSTPHMAGEMLKAYTNSSFTHIPYKGSGPAMSNLVAGQLDFSFSTIAAAKPFIDQKLIRPLATTGLERSPALPELPTIAESIPGFKVLFWTALFAPANTPPAVVKALNEAMRTVLTDPQTKAAIEKSGDVATYLPTEKVNDFVAGEFAQWTGLIAKAGIKAE